MHTFLRLERPSQPLIPWVPRRMTGCRVTQPHCKARRVLQLMMCSQPRRAAFQKVAAA